jgi:protein-disulfide isomerase
LIAKRKRKPAALMGLAVSISVALFASQSTGHDPTTKQTATEQKIIKYVRERFGVPAATKLTVSPFEDSEFGDFYKTTIHVDNGKQKSAQQIYVTKDGHYLVIGNIYTLGADPRREVERTISLQDQASVGPANAPVTIVEFADLECPTCARMHQFLENNVIPKYRNKVRIVFKEFPLVQIHDWALTAAIADQCSYQLDPAAYVRYRTAIFQNQGLINAVNVRTLLLDFGERAGLNRLKLATCIDSKASLPRVEASVREGQELGVSSTPTLFINGTPVIGLPQPDQFYKIIDNALRAAR